MAGYMGKRQAADEITTVIKETDDDSPNTRTTTIKRAPGGESTRSKSGAAGLLGLLNSYLSGGNASEEEDIWAAQNGAPSGAGMNSFIPWQSSPNERSDIGVGRSQFPRVGDLEPPQPEPIGNPGPSLNPFAGMVPFVNPRGGATPHLQQPQTFTGMSEPMRSPQEPPVSDRVRRGRPPSLTEVLFPSTDTRDVTQPQTFTGMDAPMTPVNGPDRSKSIFERLGDFNGGGTSVQPRTFTGMDAPMTPMNEPERPLTIFERLGDFNGGMQPETFTGMNSPMGPVETPVDMTGTPQTFTDMNSPMGPVETPVDMTGTPQTFTDMGSYPTDVAEKPRGQVVYPDEKPFDTVGGAEKSVVESAENDQASYTVQGQQPSMAQTDALTRTWGKLAYDPKKRRDEYMKRLNKIYANTMALEALAIISGKPSRAGFYSKMAMGKLDAMQKFDSEDRLQQLSNSLYFDRNGEYAPPANKAEAHSALMQMGATLNEATAIVGHVPEAVSQDLKEWYRYNPTTNQVETRQYPGKKGTPGAGWSQKYDVANNKFKDANPDLGNDVLGGTDAEKGMLEVELSNKLSTLVPGSVEHNNVSTQLNSLRQQIYGDPADAFKDLFPRETREGDMPQSYKEVLGKGSYSDALKHFMDPNNYDKLSYNFYRGWTPAQQGAVSTAAVNADNPPVVNSQEEYDALPSGTTYIDSNGTKATKP